LSELVASFLRRGDAAIAAAERAADAGDAETAANRAYYAMLHGASALLASEDLAVRRHSAVHAVFGDRFVKTGRIDRVHHRALLTAFDLRQVADYDAMAVITLDSAQKSLDDARASLQAVRAVLGS
jgi:uncharacterized protein (UPF0332 family)